MINGILVATDASPAANRALDLGADLAAKYGVTLSILYVARDMQLPAEVSGMAELKQLAGPRREVFLLVGQRIISDARKRAQSMGVERIDTAVAEGDPAGQIINHAEARGVNLIVMGTRGLGQMKSMLLGSVSRKVINSTDISCLVVKGETDTNDAKPQ